MWTVAPSNRVRCHGMGVAGWRVYLDMRQRTVIDADDPAATDQDEEVTSMAA